MDRSRHEGRDEGLVGIKRAILNLHSPLAPPNPHCGLDPQSLILMGPQGIVYILTNKNNTTLYTGVTRDLQRRVAEHKLHLNKGFSDKYNTERLVYYEVYDRLDVGIHREKQLKKWHREWKEKLINDFNPDWKDLAVDIGVDAEYIQAVKDAYDNGQYIAGE